MAHLRARAWSRAARSFGRSSRASAPLPVSTSMCSPASSRPSASAKRRQGARNEAWQSAHRRGGIQGRRGKQGHGRSLRRQRAADHRAAEGRGSEPTQDRRGVERTRHRDGARQRVDLGASRQRSQARLAARRIASVRRAIAFRARPFFMNGKRTESRLAYVAPPEPAELARKARAQPSNASSLDQCASAETVRGFSRRRQIGWAAPLFRRGESWRGSLDRKAEG
jgi:hypothetical protein